MGTSQERRPCRGSNATRTGPLSEAMPACRGRRADHAQKDRAGTWEIPRSARAIPLLVRIGKGEPKADDERTREVGPSVVATKLANKAERSAAEPAEPRAGTKGNANQQHTAGRRAGKPCHRCWCAYVKPQATAICRHSPEVGAVCGKAARTDLCGGRGAISVPTATDLCGASSRQLSEVDRTCCQRSRDGSLW